MPEIARELGVSPNLVRRAVAANAWHRSATTRRDDRKRGVSRPLRALASPPLAPPDPIAPPTIPFITRALSQCAWIDGDPKRTPVTDLMCCGRPAVFGGSWCAHHKTIVYGPEAT